MCLSGYINKCGKHTMQQPSECIWQPCTHAHLNFQQGSSKQDMNCNARSQSITHAHLNFRQGSSKQDMNCNARSQSAIFQADCLSSKILGTRGVYSLGFWLYTKFKLSLAHPQKILYIVS